MHPVIKFIVLFVQQTVCKQMVMCCRMYALLVKCNSLCIAQDIFRGLQFEDPIVTQSMYIFKVSV